MTSIIIGTVAAAICIGLLAYAFMPGRHTESDAIDRRLGSDDRRGGATNATSTVQKQSTPQLMAAVKRAAPKIAAPMSDEEQSRLRKKLSAAGIRGESAPVIFLASKTVLGLGASGLTILLTMSSNLTGLNVGVITVFVGGLFFMLPDLFVSQAAQARATKIKKALADCVDMMVIMVEAGLGMDGAINRVSTEMNDTYPELSEEFRIANAEMNMGLPRNEALQNLADRTGVREIQTLVATIVQAERFGSSIGKTLRVQSDMMRMKRQQAAEEAAGKTAVKLLIPLILFIFPALMIVVGGPAAMNLLENADALN
jgi:tight adherence protein C